MIYDTCDSLLLLDTIEINYRVIVDVLNICFKWLNLPRKENMNICDGRACSPRRTSEVHVQFVYFSIELYLIDLMETVIFVKVN